VARPDFLKYLNEEVHEALFDKSKPLCLVLDFNYYKMKYGGHQTDAEWSLVLKGAHIVSNKPSQKVVDVVERVVSALSEFNVAHVRRGDRGTPQCTSASEVVDAMLSATSTSEPWVVMSDGDEAWWQNLKSKAETDDPGTLQIKTEMELPGISSIKDNYFKYFVLSCIFAKGEHVLATHKDISANCKEPGPVHQSLTFMCEQQRVTRPESS